MNRVSMSYVIQECTLTQTHIIKELQMMCNALYSGLKPGYPGQCRECCKDAQPDFALLPCSIRGSARARQSRSLQASWAICVPSEPCPTQWPGKKKASGPPWVPEALRPPNANNPWVVVGRFRVGTTFGGGPRFRSSA